MLDTCIWCYMTSLWASLQIRKIAGCACAGNAGNVFPVPLCMSGSLTSGFLWSLWRGKRSRHSRHMRNPQFYVSGKRPMPQWGLWCQIAGLELAHLTVWHLCCAVSLSESVWICYQLEPQEQNSVKMKSKHKTFFFTENAIENVCELSASLLGPMC